MAKKKYYVVWSGHTQGIFDSWDACKLSISGYKNAVYKSFPTLAEATHAYKNQNAKDIKKRNFNTTIHASSIIPVQQSLSVDAACSGNPGNMEYRGVIVKTRQEIFRVGPLPDGTNNIGEFLAIVHGLAYLKNAESQLPIYTDSVTAISWIRQKKCNTKLLPTHRNAEIFNLIERAEKWLHTHTYTTVILKWDTAQWGEIPADFGRK